MNLCSLTIKGEKSILKVSASAFLKKTWVEPSFMMKKKTRTVLLPEVAVLAGLAGTDLSVSEGEFLFLGGTKRDVRR